VESANPVYLTVFPRDVPAFLAVLPGGPAESSGMRAGDVILEVDQAPVAGGLDAEQKLREAGEKTLLGVPAGRGELLRRDQTPRRVMARDPSTGLAAKGAVAVWRSTGSLAP
jgi:membrane-associated protease RseP (regulator of RpoE activity)